MQHRRREPSRGGKMVRPSLGRRISEPGHTWPSTTRQRRSREVNIRGLLETLVIASCKSNSTVESDSDGSGDADDGDAKHEDRFLSHMVNSWQRVGPRMRQRQQMRRSDSMLESVPRPDTA
ncbi:hypothetical protein NX059_001712 [Plenodomus lindquistii]|nr:hypothetical protein NX059_001712 [Plenodomus lindquistii]